MTTIDIGKIVEKWPDVLVEYFLTNTINFIHKLKPDFDSKELLRVFFI